MSPTAHCGICASWGMAIVRLAIVQMSIMQTETQRLHSQTERQAETDVHGWHGRARAEEVYYEQWLKLNAGTNST